MPIRKDKKPKPQKSRSSLKGSKMEKVDRYLSDRKEAGKHGQRALKELELGVRPRTYDERSEPLKTNKAKI